MQVFDSDRNTIEIEMTFPILVKMDIQIADYVAKVAPPNRINIVPLITKWYRTDGHTIVYLN